MIIKKIKVNDHILGNDLDALEITIEKKQVILTKHFYEQAIKRKLFPNDIIDDEHVKKAVKKFGIFHPDFREENKRFCIITNKDGGFLTLPVKEYDNKFGYKKK